MWCPFHARKKSDTHSSSAQCESRYDIRIGIKSKISLVPVDSLFGRFLSMISGKSKNATQCSVRSILIFSRINRPTGSRPRDERMILKASSATAGRRALVFGPFEDIKRYWFIVYEVLFSCLGSFLGTIFLALDKHTKNCPPPFVSPTHINSFMITFFSGPSLPCRWNSLVAWLGWCVTVCFYFPGPHPQAFCLLSSMA